MEIVRFKSWDLWGKTGYKDESKEEIEIVGKFYNSSSKDTFLGELVDSNMVAITILKEEKVFNTNLVDGEYYKIRGKIKKYPDRFSDNVKLFVQIIPQEIEYLQEKNYPEQLKEDIKKIKRLEEEINKRERKSIEDIKKIIEKDRNSLLYIVSDVAQDGKRDILNDLYSNDSENILNEKFGLNSENIIRVKFNSKDWNEVLAKFTEKIKKYQAIVFIKGGGSSMKFFDDIDFCDSVLNLDKPFITAVGHADDDERLLCRLADINYQTPTLLGVKFLEMFSQKSSTSNEIKQSYSGGLLKESFSNFEKMKTQITSLKEENSSLIKKVEGLKEYEEKNKNLIKEINSLTSNNKNYEKNIEKLNLDNHSLKEDIKSLKRKLKFKNILLLFLIPLVIFFNMVYLYFFSPRKEIINQPIKETMKVENKKETQTTKEEKNNLIEKVQEKISQKIEDKKIIKEDKKEISKVERKKRLVYSEDDVYTVLLWKGYKGEKAINNFQKDNGMKVTGKVDETLLKKLGVKYRFE